MKIVLAPLRPEPDELLIGFSDTAYQQLISLNAVEHAAFITDLENTYCSCYAQFQHYVVSTFAPRGFTELVLFLRNEFSNFIADKYTIRVSIDHSTYQWHDNSIGSPGSLARYKFEWILPIFS